jgi:hypothetical protein
MYTSRQVGALKTHHHLVVPHLYTEDHLLQAAFSTTARPTATQSVRIAPLHQHVQLRRCVQARASGGDQLVDSLLANIPNAVVRTAIKV